MKFGATLSTANQLEPRSSRTIHLVGTEVLVRFLLGRLDFGLVLDVYATGVLKVSRIDFVDLMLAWFYVWTYLREASVHDWLKKLEEDDLKIGHETV